LQQVSINPVLKFKFSLQLGRLGFFKHSA